MPDTTSIRVCFVCLGNICRSPTAEGIFLTLVEEAKLGDRFEIDSAGTAAYHIGKAADPRSAATARARGTSLPSRARKFMRPDFDRFDYVIAMDRSNREDLLRLAPDAECERKVHLLRAFGPAEARDADGLHEDVPDPYYGGARGFEDVYDICATACAGLLRQLRSEHELS